MIEATRVVVPENPERPQIGDCGVSGSPTRLFFVCAIGGTCPLILGYDLESLALLHGCYGSSFGIRTTSSDVSTGSEPNHLRRGVLVEERTRDVFEEDLLTLFDLAGCSLFPPSPPTLPGTQALPWPGLS